MRRWTLAVAFGLLLSWQPDAQAAVPLGLQPGKGDACEPAATLGAHWTRIVADPSDATIAPRIRAAHACGLHVILTLGGIGTDAKLPSLASLRAAVSSLPRAERYTVVNEPDLTGINVCTYTRLWKAMRRVLGSRLLWGDFSPYFGLSFTLAALEHCGALRRQMHEVAAHPYDHLPAHTTLKDGQMTLPHLPAAALALRRAGLRVHWWLTEFGYHPDDAWRWPLALRRADALAPAVLMMYAADGPTWRTAAP